MVIQVVNMIGKVVWLISKTKQRIYGLSRVGKVFGRSPLNSLYLKGDEKWT